MSQREARLFPDGSSEHARLISVSCARQSNRLDISLFCHIPVQPRVDQIRGGRVTNQVNAGPELGKIFQNILLFALVTLFFGVEGSILSWLVLHGILPLLTFFYLGRYGLRVGNRLVLTGCAIALTGSLFFQAVGSLLVAFSLIPTGYVLAHAAIRQDTPASAGLKGIIALGGCWLILIGLFTLTHETAPYAVLLSSTDQGIAEALEYYRQSDAVSPEALGMLETTLYQMKIVLPLIMPAIFTGFIILTVWFAMAVGNKILYQVSGQSPWPRYRTWQLPERLVWLVIAGALLALLPLGSLKIWGINLLISLSIVYCLQGLAVFSFFVHKWNVPLFLRSFLYVMIVFQSLGTILLLAVGLADVWLDLRKLKRPADPEITDI